MQFDWGLARWMGCNAIYSQEVKSLAAQWFTAA